MAASAVPAGEKPHAVCVPFPAQGHVTPMMKLAKVLYCKGFHVTFVNTEYNHRRLIRSRGPSAVAGLPGFRFDTIPDGLPPSDADATQDPASICHSTMTTCLPHLQSLLARLNSTDGVPPVTCVVADNIMSFSVDAAKELGVPCALFWTASACGYMGYRHFRFLLDEGLAPLKDEEQLTNGYLDTPVGWARGMSKHMRLRDFPTFIYTMRRGDDILLDFIMREVERTGAATAVIINTFYELEQTALDAMRAVLPPVYTIGPLTFLLEQLAVPDGAPIGTIRSSLWKEDHDCLRWLDGKPSRSVVYVNYGCITTMSNQELVEFAWGLANSGYEFLWIIRPDLVKGETAVLPPEFLETTKSRCLLTSWCDQEAVLRHEAVGVFLTHSGWNSTMESLCGGVPMLCWPFFAEQQTNCRYACVEWGVGMEVGGDVRREVLEGRIREAMAGEKGREMSRGAAQLKEAAVRATQPGGRALTDLDDLINSVLLPRKS
ncbi:7-deoxyloganetin glucosyltransferase-like [Phragmites australis]|uniref:7-deoxyloganetin glucosyltransferase-like n=1 Tax=Phragmites australis TaxID=29695 RepID=UPI002D789A3F|nr:7-deoxyloganetin glucosyltransferase-like [Phragmites australis]